MFVSGTFDADYVDTGVFVDAVDQLFDSFNSNKHVPPFEELLRPLSCDSPHMGYWDKAGTGVSSWIFLKDGKPAFNCCILLYTSLGPSQKRIVDVTFSRSQGSFSVRTYT